MINLIVFVAFHRTKSWGKDIYTSNTELVKPLRRGLSEHARVHFIL